MDQPCPILILENNDGDRFVSRFDKMGQILRQPQYADKELVIISVVGTTRRGKSFLVNLLLMYLYGKEFDMSYLFSFRGGAVAQTKGIYMWSEPFIRKLASGKEVAIVLMDTQGTFDNQTTTAGNSIIFGLSTILSSVQIFNIMDNISEDDLKHLTMFSQFASMACKSSTQNKKTFQNLIFLIRDWINDNNYGFEGGNRLLEKVLKIEGRPEGLQSLRRTLLASFETISAFLCPDPGAFVKSPGFSGKLQDCSLPFQSQVKKFFDELISERFLQPKRINGRTITSYDAQDIFNEYFEALLRNPSAENLITATENLQFSAAYNLGVKEFTDFTESTMQRKVCYGKYELEDELIRKKNAIINCFPKSKTVSTFEARQKQIENLESFMKELIGKVLKQNDEKIRYEKAVEDSRQIQKNHELNQQKHESEMLKRLQYTPKPNYISPVNQQEIHLKKEQMKQTAHDEEMKKMLEEQQRLLNERTRTSSTSGGLTLKEQEEKHYEQRVKKLECDLKIAKDKLDEIRCQLGKGEQKEKYWIQKKLGI